MARVAERCDRLEIAAEESSCCCRVRTAAAGAPCQRHAPRPNILQTINFHQLPKAGASRSRIREASTTEFDINSPSEDRVAQDCSAGVTACAADTGRYRNSKAGWQAAQNGSQGTVPPLSGVRGQARGHRGDSQTVPPLSGVRGQARGNRGESQTVPPLSGVRGRARGPPAVRTKKPSQTVSFSPARAQNPCSQPPD